MGWGPGLANREKGNRVPACIALWFLLQRQCDQLSPALAAMPFRHDGLYPLEWQASINPSVKHLVTAIHPLIK